MAVMGPIVKEVAMMTMTATMETRMEAMKKIAARKNRAVCLKMRKHSRE